MEDLYEASMSRIVDHLDSDDIATIASFITQGGWNRMKDKQALSKDETIEEIVGLTSSIGDR